MIKEFKGYKVLTPSGYKNLDFTIDSGKFTSFKDTKILPKYKVIPGFFDIHTHGANGKDFTTVKDENDIKAILDFYKSKGVTSVFPTLLTEHDSLIFRQLELIYKASLTNPIIKGIHLEGPFLSSKYKGAQLEECLQDPSISKCEEFIKHSHGLFKYMTIAPEKKGSEEVIKFLVNKGIKVSLGHSDASFNDVTIAKNSGATNFTHLFNAMRPISHHLPSISEAGLYYDDMFTEVIVDGAHIDPNMVEFIYKIKKEDRFIAITDSLMSAGLPDGEYKIGNTPIIVKGKDCLIKGTSTRAGSVLNMLDAFRNVKKFLNLDDLIASKLTSFNASKSMGLDNIIGSIEKNKNADFLILDDNDNLLETYINGEKVYFKNK